MRARYWLLTLLLLAFPRSAAAQAIDPLTNIGWCIVQPFAAGATSITVEPAGCGADLPSTAFNLSVCQITDNPANCRTAAAVKDTSYEIVRVTSGFGTDTLTITRAQEGTSDVAHNTGGKTYAVSTFTAKTITDINTALGATFLTTSTNSVLTNEAVLTGTANQVILTGSTLSTPQNMHTAATPTFGGLTLSGLTADRLVTSSTGGLLQSDNFRVDSTNGFLGIGLTGTPGQRLAVRQNWTPQTVTLGNYHEAMRIASTVYGGGNGSTPRNALGVWVTDDPSISTKTITGAANNGSGLVRITATAHGFTTGDAIGVYGVTGTTEANGGWDITVIDANTFDLQGSTFANAYVSGGSATTRPSLGGVIVNVQPAEDRTSAGINSEFNDDVTAFAANNPTNFRATDAFYVGGGGPAAAPAWTAAFTTDADSRFHYRATGKAYLAALDFSTVTYDGTAPAIDLGPAGNIRLDTATGTKIGTATTQKLGFFGATPIVQPSSTTDLRQSLINLGLYATGGASPLHLNGGTLTAANAVVTNTSGTPLTATIGGVTKFTISSDGQLFNYVEGGFNPVFVRNSANAGGISHAMVKGRGTGALPQRALSGDVLGGLLMTGYYAATDGATDAVFDISAASATLRAITLEAFSSTARGAYLQMQTVPVGSATLTTRAMVSTTGLSIGSALAARGTTEPTNALNIFDGTAPVGTLTNGVSLYSASGEAKIKDAAGIEQMLSPHNKALTDNVATDVLSLTVATLTGTGGRLNYSIEATDGTDIQVETGQVTWTAINKAGTVTAAVTEVNSQQSVSAGTMTTAWTITAANPAVIRVNADTSLTPSGGYPRITFRVVDNLGRQAFTLP